MNAALALNRVRNLAEPLAGWAGQLCAGDILRIELDNVQPAVQYLWATVTMERPEGIKFTAMFQHDRADGGLIAQEAQLCMPYDARIVDVQVHAVDATMKNIPDGATIHVGSAPLERYPDGFIRHC